ncbi:MAG: outer membrane protein assembly factor BamA [Deltaproteobacteria bacterium]|nr:outer membrane protein assembly factor BamA [Candidatus Deferrimicrobium borealis]
MARSSRLAPLIFAGWLAFLPVPSAGEEDRPPAGSGPVIASISFQVPSPYQVTYEECYGLVTLRPGDRLTEEKVRESIRRLYTRSVFREVTAYVREDGGKAHLLFFLRPVPLVAEIEVSGQKSVTAAQIISSSRIRRGGPLEERDLAEAETAVRAFLAGRGFTTGKCTIQVSCSVVNGAGKVRITVEEGMPGLVGTLAIPGAAFFPPERIAEILGVEAGKPFDFQGWEKGLTRIRMEYKKSGFLTVRVEGSVPLCGDGIGLCPKAEVVEGRRYDVRWEGVREFSPEKLAKVSGLYGTEEVTEGALTYDLRERILAFYRKERYLRAQVDVAVGEESDGKVPLTVKVQEGQAGFIKEIRFEGNRGIPADALLRQMSTRKRRTFHWFTGSGKFSEEEWRQDQNAIVGYYQKEGYVRMKIAGVDDEWDAGGGITKVVRVEEGTRYRLREIRFLGNDHFLRSEFLALMRNKEGMFVDYIGLEHDQEAIAAKYRNSGFLDATVEGTLDFDEGKDTVVARFTFVEGSRYRLGSVIVQGNLLTDPVAVLRENPIPSGRYAGEEALLEFQQSVYGTGLYKSVRLQRVKRPAEGVLDLVVEVEETMFLDLEFGGGYATDTGVRGSVYAKDRNLDGLGRSLSGLVLVGQKQQNYQLEMREPYIFGNRWKWEGVLTASHLFKENPSFNLKKSALIAGINHEILERSTVSLQYEFSLDETFDVEPGAIISQEDQGRANIASVRALVVLDFRDDPFNPKRGMYASGVGELASELLGSQVDYWSLTGQTSFYLPVIRRNSLALSARAGLVLPYGISSEVPIQKRFFAGGRTTVRGFKQDTLGPIGADGAPIGGEFQLILNAEMRVPLQYGLLAAAFVDAGSVWLRNPSVYGFDLRETAGLSIRYITPVGPISVDYGWKLDRRPGESAGEWSFTIGMVF